MVIELQFHFGAEGQAMGRSAEMEYSDRVSFPDTLAFVRGDLAGGDFSHADPEETHQADVPVIGFKEDQSPGGDGINRRARPESMILLAGRSWAGGPLALLRLIYPQGTAAHVFAIEVLDGSRGIGGGHLHESESARPTRLPVGDQTD
jgi:hypothetical protein